MKIRMIILVSMLVWVFIPCFAQNRNAWMQEAKWGVMTHYLSDWIARRDSIDMNVGKWNDMIDHFDVNGLADQLESVGVGYYLLTLGQNSGYYLAPNDMYDQLVGNDPTKCAKRDLVTDMYNALQGRGIKLMVYLPSGAPAGDRKAREALEWENGPYRNKNFQIKWEQVIKAWSDRFGEKIVGWWFDGCYWPNAMYRYCDPPNFESFAAAARSGNPQSVLAFCQGVVPRLVSVTPEEDYIAGEMSNPADLSIRHEVDGKVDGKQVHVLSYLGERWGGGQPRFEIDQVLEWSREVRRHHGVITWDVPIQTNGSISEPFMDQLKAIGEEMNKK